jgi:hypothetical protein
MPVTFKVGDASTTVVTHSGGFAFGSIVMQRPGTYDLTTSVSSPDGNITTGEPVPHAITVIKQPTLLLLNETPGSVPTDDTSYTAQVCGTTDVVCNDYDGPVAGRTVVFKLSGPIDKTVATITNGSGQARFDAYGLPAGSYSLRAYFLGDIPGVGTLSDPYYAAATPAVAEFSKSGAGDTAAPTLTVPSNITVTAPSGTTGATVAYVVSAHDAIDPRPSVTCTPPSASFFAVGTTTVNCTTTDTAGNSANGSFTVTVNAPVTTAISVSVAGTQVYGSTATFTYTASPPSGVTLSGTLTCTKLSTGTTISPALAGGTYRIDPSTCSGLSASNGATITYVAPANDFTVTKAASTLTAAPALHSGTKVTFSATLKRTSNGSPISGQTITFSASGKKICSATTNASGVASCTVFTSVLSRRPASYTATYAGSTNYLGSTATARI